MIAPRKTLPFFFLCMAAGFRAIGEPSFEPIEVRTNFAKDAIVTTVAHNAMGTTFRITLVGDPEQDSPGELARIANEAFEGIDALESRISRWRVDSQTSRINKYAFTEPVKVTNDVARFLLDAQQLSADTGGAFDCTVGPLIEVWRAARESGELPSQSAIDHAMEVVGFENVVIDRPERLVRFTKEGTQLDFGAIGKGLALDLAAEILADYGIKVALLDAGTSTYLATGAPPGEPGWTVRVRHPYNEGEVLTEIILSAGAFSTSTNAGSKLVVDGREYGHILDPRTGWPVQDKRLAMSLAESAATADALSTAFYVMDEDSIRRYCSEHLDVRAIIVPDGEPNTIRINFENGEE